MATRVTNADPAVAPAIAGTLANQATTFEAALAPFANVVVSDANPQATDTLTITLSGAGGNAVGRRSERLGFELYTERNGSGDNRRTQLSPSSRQLPGNRTRARRLSSRCRRHEQRLSGRGSRCDDQRDRQRPGGLRRAISATGPIWTRWRTASTSWTRRTTWPAGLDALNAGPASRFDRAQRRRNTDVEADDRGGAERRDGARQDHGRVYARDLGQRDGHRRAVGPGERLKEIGISRRSTRPTRNADAGRGRYPLGAGLAVNGASTVDLSGGVLKSTDRIVRRRRLTTLAAARRGAVQPRAAGDAEQHRDRDGAGRPSGLREHRCDEPGHRPARRDSLVVNVASDPSVNPANPKAATISIVGAANSDTINLGSGTDMRHRRRSERDDQSRHGQSDDQRHGGDDRRDDRKRDRNQHARRQRRRNGHDGVEHRRHRQRAAGLVDDGLPRHRECDLRA